MTSSRPGQSAPATSVTTFGREDLDAAASFLSELAATYERGLIVCGPTLAPPGELTAALAAASSHTAWPVLTDIGAPARTDPRVETIARTEPLLRSPSFIADLKPADVVVQIGDHHLSKALRLWLDRHPPRHMVLVDPDQRWQNPSFGLTAHIAIAPAHLLHGLVNKILAPISRPRAWPQATDPSQHAVSWADQWLLADRAATEVIEAHSDLNLSSKMDQPALAHRLLRTVPPDHILYLSNSMPIRDVDSFGAAPQHPVEVHVHRGANGIDGLISAAAGAALATGRRATLYSGDLAFLHDIGGLVTAERLDVPLTIVVPDNSGGGIFSQLPVAKQVDPESFDDLFHTPHGLDLVDVAGIGKVRSQRVMSLPEFEAAYAEAARRDGVDVIVVPIDHAHDVSHRRQLQGQIAQRLAPKP